ncbi:MAG: hypothetical protein ACRDTR_00415 [Rubrobacter sp.]
MSQQGTAGLVRIGILTIPLAGLLALVGLLGNYSLPGPNSNPEQTARYFSSTVYFVSQFAGNIVGPSLMIFGAISLTVYLADTRSRRLALAGMIFCFFSIGLVISVAGLAAYAVPAVGRAYLGGKLSVASAGIQQTPRELVLLILGSPAREVFVVVFLLYSTGFLLFGVAIWRSGVMHRLASISLALHAPLLSSFTRTEPTWTSFLGALLFILGGTMISRDVFRGPPGEATPPEPRVR